MVNLRPVVVIVVLLVAFDAGGGFCEPDWFDGGVPATFVISPITIDVEFVRLGLNVQL